MSWFRWLLRLLRYILLHERRAVRLRLYGMPVEKGQSPSGRIAVEVKRMERVPILPAQDGMIVVSPVDLTGAPAKVQEGSVKAVSSDAAEMADGVVEDIGAGANSIGLRCVTINAVPGHVIQYHVTADADLGEGVEEISGDMEFEILEPRAAALGLTGKGVAKKDAPAAPVGPTPQPV